ncbi:MAG: replication initiation protein [Rhizobium sp.]|nr:replication initiation protein [Rhizobium sp.]
MPTIFVQDGWQRWGEMPLLWHDYLRNQETGARYLSYSIHPAIRKVILESDRWAKLEINAFPKFSCKYTARLYPRLVLMAQRHPIFVKKKPAWTTKPEELAELIGYRYKGKFHFGNFQARCLDPVKSDINAHVKRFNMRWDPVRGSGRGSPVTHIEITTNTLGKSHAGSLAEAPKVPLDGEGYERLHQAIQEGTDKYHRIMPSTELVRAAATRMECDVEAVVQRWRAALLSAANRSDSTIPDTTMMGYQLMSLMHDDGPGYAFERWVRSLVKPEMVIKEPRPHSNIVWIKYDGTQSHERAQTVVHNIEPPVQSLSPSEELALCDLNHDHWREMRRPLYEDECDALVGAFAYLRDDFSVSHRKNFLAGLDKIMDRTHPADRGKKIKTMADAKVKELRSLNL